MLDSLWTWLVAALSPFNASTLLGYFLKPFQHYFLLKCSARPDNIQCSLSESCSRCIPDINTLKCSDSHPWLIFAGSVLCKHWEWTWNVDTAAGKMFMLGKRLVFFLHSMNPFHGYNPPSDRDANRVFHFYHLQRNHPWISEHWYHRMSLFGIFKNSSTQTSLTSWQGNDSSSVLVLFNRATLFMRRWLIEGQYAL